jgi:hypothetical protein
MLIHRRTETTVPTRGFLERPFREARLRAYIARQHRAGRPLAEILRDPYVARCGSDSFCRRVLVDARTIDALEQNMRSEFERLRQIH